MRHSGHLREHACWASSPSIVVSTSILQRGDATTNTQGGGTTLTIAKPIGVVAGDVMIVNIQLRGGTNNTFPSLSGWTNVTTPVAFEANGNRRCALLYRVADASDTGSSYTFNLGSNASQSAGAIVAFSGVDTSGPTPFDVTPGSYSFSTTAGTTISATAITTASANAAVLMFAATEENQTITSFSTTSPGALSELYGASSPFPTGNGTVAGAWNLKATAGSTGTGTATISQSKRWAGILLALKPVGTTLTVSTATGTYGGSTGQN